MMNSSIFKGARSKKKLDPIKQSTLENESFLLKSINEKDKEVYNFDRTKKKENNNILFREQNYLTPLDFIQLIRTDPEMNDEFCYLIKRDDPYDWQIVEFSQIQKANKRNTRKGKDSVNEYMTISSRGITHFLDDEATFVTLDDWEREYRLYKE